MHILSGVLDPLIPTLLASLVALAVLAVWGGRPRRGVLLVLGLAAGAIVYRGALPAVIVLNAAAWLVVTALADVGPALRRWRLTQALMVALAAVALWGRASGISAAAFSAGGVSWVPIYLDMMLFMRLEAYVWEVGAGRTGAGSLVELLEWSLLPFAIFGPLIRFSAWRAQGGADQRAAPDPKALWRLAGLGAAQLLGAGGLAYVRVLASPVLPHRAELGLELLLLNPWGFYLLATGSVNLMIAMGGAVGIRLPDGFNRPFGRPNLSAFWANWNIPITSLVRDVLFYQRWGLGYLDVYVSTMLVFVAIGAWHAGNAYWITWGLLHGIGFSIYLLYARRARRASAGGVLAARVGSLVPGAALTYIFVCACWALPPQLARLFHLS